MNSSGRSEWAILAGLCVQWREGHAANRPAGPPWQRNGKPKGLGRLEIYNRPDTGRKFNSSVPALSSIRVVAAPNEASGVARQTPNFDTPPPR